MGAAADRVVTPPRSRRRAYLVLARASNLPTIWSNVLAGLAAAGAVMSFGLFATLAFAVSLLYTGGMFLNDAFDSRFDATHRPDRPIPAGEVGRAETYVVGFVLLAAGVIVLTLAGTNRAVAASYASALAAAIVYYDARHKRDPNSPLVMGLCRGLVYCAAAAAAAVVTQAVVLAALVITAYVALVTMAAKHGTVRLGRWIAPLLAGISLVDGAVIAANGRMGLAIVAALGFPLTLAAQRIVKGT